MEKRWVIKPKADEVVVSSLALELKIDRVLANLLVQRGDSRNQLVGRSHVVA